MNYTWIERRLSMMFPKKDTSSSKDISLPTPLITKAQVDASAQIFTQDTVVNSVIQQLIERSNFGLTKYGTTLDRDDLDLLDWIEHSKQEAMDFVLYLEKMKRVLLATRDTMTPSSVDIIPSVSMTTHPSGSMTHNDSDQQLKYDDSKVIFRN
jgi:hypothetical protein